MWGFKSFIRSQKKAHICLPRQCVLFSTKSAFVGINPLSWMKSLRDEILLRKVKGGGFNFIWSRRLKISSEHREDFIVQRTISLRIQGYALILVRLCGTNRIPPSPPEKSTCESKCFFQLNPPMAEEIPLAWDEIALRWNPTSSGEERRI